MNGLNGFLFADVGAGRIMTPLEGFCATTAYEQLACAPTAAKGAWPLRNATSWRAAAHECLSRCSACERCQYVSFSIEQSDCSWFKHCDTSKLHRSISGFVTLPALAASSLDLSLIHI